MKFHSMSSNHIIQDVLDQLYVNEYCPSYRSLGRL